MNNSIPISEVAYILNISTNYVYRLIREHKLDVVKSDPLMVSSKSVVKRLIQLQPFLEYALPSRLDYAVQKHTVHSW